MKIGIYFCSCGTNISEKVDTQRVLGHLQNLADVIYIEIVDFLCSEEGKEFLENSLKERMPDRVVIAACSPREHETTFMSVLRKVGINPYYMQMVNIRELVAWVTSDKEKAAEKVLSYLHGAINRVGFHEPLEPIELTVCPDVLIIGAGPAGLKTALNLAEAGRNVTIVEKSPVLGGMPFLYEELAPNMECGPCMLEPIIDDVLHKEFEGNIEHCTLSEVTDVAGYFGNFIVTIKQFPRYVDLEKCIGCGECIPPCPVSTKNEFNLGLNSRKAISFPFLGGMPNIPFIDNKTCLRFKGKECVLCKNACMLEDVIRFEDREIVFEKKVGAILLAIGSTMYDCRSIKTLGYGNLAEVYTSVEFERILSSNGPTEGKIITKKGKKPESLAIIHCAGSLDENYIEYCSGICCQSAFKYNHIVTERLPNAKIFHFFKEVAVTGKEGHSLYERAKKNPHSLFVRYKNIQKLIVSSEKNRCLIRYTSSGGKQYKLALDMIILCPAIVPSGDTVKFAKMMDVPTDKYGFFQELHDRLDSAQSKIKGIYLAGTCQAPMDIQKAINQGIAASGYILSGLPEGKTVQIDPIYASIIDEKCSNCRVCTLVCPYKAVYFNEETDTMEINSILCQGCGTCASACPAGAIKANHFTEEELSAEIQGVLV